MDAAIGSTANGVVAGFATILTFSRMGFSAGINMLNLLSNGWRYKYLFIWCLHKSGARRDAKR
jgi:hypothetical protein